MYTIEQLSRYGWEPIPNGDFQTRADAESAMQDLQDKLGWHDLRIVEELRNPYPDGLTAVSARDASNGPRDQVIAELRRILDLCVDWGTPQAEILRDECREYLEDMGA